MNALRLLQCLVLLLAALFAGTEAGSCKGTLPDVKVRLALASARAAWA